MSAQEAFSVLKSGLTPVFSAVTNSQRGTYSGIPYIFSSLTELLPARESHRTPRTVPSLEKYSYRSTVLIGLVIISNGFDVTQIPRVAWLGEGAKGSEESSVGLWVEDNGLSAMSIAAYSVLQSKLQAFSLAEKSIPSGSQIDVKDCPSELLLLAGFSNDDADKVQLGTSDSVWQITAEDKSWSIDVLVPHCAFAFSPARKLSEVDKGLAFKAPTRSDPSARRLLALADLEATAKYSE